METHRQNFFFLSRICYLLGFLSINGSANGILMSRKSNALTNFHQILMIINHTQDMFFTLNGGVASWKSLKQETTIDFTTKVTYISAFEAEKKVI
jgi:hypothetical protein